MRRPRAMCALLLVAAWPAAAAAQPRESVVLTTPGMERAFVLAARPFAAAGAESLFFDAYFPGPARPREPLPAIVFVSGGANVRAWPWYASYGRLAAAHGFVGIVPDKRYTRGWDGTKAGHDDTVAFLEYLAAHAAELGVDPARVCVWVFSAGGRMAAIPLAGRGMPVRALVAYYAVLDAAAQVPEDAAERDALLARYSPLHALAGADSTAPKLLVVRAGKDSPAINGGLDRFVAAAIAANLDLRLVNFAGGVHGFDGYDPGEASRAVIAGTFRWIAESTGAP